MAFKCKKCGGILKQTGCLECGTVIGDDAVVELETKARKCQSLFESATGLLNEGRYEEALATFTRCQEERETFLYRDHRDLAQGEDAIARCHATLGNFSDSADHLFNSVKFAELMYGKSSAEFAHELQKLAEVLFNAERFYECLEVSSQAFSLLGTLYSDQHDSVKQIKDLKIAAEMALMPVMMN